MTPYDLFKFCDDSIPGIKFFYVPKEEIEKIQPDQERRFAKGHTIAGTRENHQFRPINFNKLQVSRVSNDATAFTVNAFEADEEISYISNANLQPGQYVTCMYDNFWWVGNVCEVSHEEQDVLISFMHPHGSARSFHWPTTKDRCWIPEQHIFMTLEASSTSSSEDNTVIHNLFWTKLKNCLNKNGTEFFVVLFFKFAVCFNCFLVCIE